MKKLVLLDNDIFMVRHIIRTKDLLASFGRDFKTTEVSAIHLNL